MENCKNQRNEQVNRTEKEIGNKLYLGNSPALMTMHKGKRYEYVEREKGQDPILWFSNYEVLELLGDYCGVELATLEGENYIKFLNDSFYNKRGIEFEEDDFQDPDSRCFITMKHVCDHLNRDVIQFLFNCTKIPGAGCGIALTQIPGIGLDYTKVEAVKLQLQRVAGEKIVIINWDLVHSNEIQEAFYENENVLTISIHQKRFSPNHGHAYQTGKGDGEGRNINIEFSKLEISDGDIICAFQNIIFPILSQFEPTSILIPTHFRRDENYRPISANCYGNLLYYLSNFAEGKIILSLDIECNLNSINNELEICTKTLLGRPNVGDPMRLSPSQIAVNDIKSAYHYLKEFWSAL